MSSGNAHQAAFVILFAVVVGGLIVFGHVKPDLLTLGAAFLFGLIASTFSDIDIGTSRIRKKVQLTLIVLAMFFMILFALEIGSYMSLGVALILMLLLMSLTLSKHRKFCHSLKFMVLTTGAVYLFVEFLLNKGPEKISAPIVALAWAGGILLHLIMDDEL